MFGDIDIDTIQFDEVAKGRQGGQSIAFLPELPVIQTPRMGMVAGVTVSNYSFQTKFHVDAYFRKTTVHNAFLQFLKDLDDMVIRVASEQSEAWFRKAMTKQEVARFYMSYVKSDDAGNSYMKLNLPHKVDKCPIPTFHGQTVMDVLPERHGAGGSVVLRVQPCNLWFFNNMFGIRWKVHEVHFSDKVFQLEQPSQTYQFQDD